MTFRSIQKTQLLTAFSHFAEAHYPDTVHYLNIPSSVQPIVLQGRVERTQEPPPDSEPEPSEDGEEDDDSDDGGSDAPAPPVRQNNDEVLAALEQIGALLQQIAVNQPPSPTHAAMLLHEAMQTPPPRVFEAVPDSPVRAVPERRNFSRPQLNEAYDQTVRRIQDIYRENIQASLSDPVQGNLARAVAQAYSPASAAVTQYDVPPVTDPVEPPSTAFTERGLAGLRGNGSGNVAPIVEDVNWIRSNLAAARKPVSMNDLMASEYMQRQADLSRMSLEAKLDNELAQSEWARAAGRENVIQGRVETTQPLPAGIPLPPAEMVNPQTGHKEDLWPRLQQGDVLNDGELKQIFHAIDLKKYGASSPLEKIEAEAARLYTEQKIAENMVSHAPQDEEGNLYFGDVPIRSADALYFALEDVRHFQQTDLHLNPRQLIAIRNSQNADLNANTAYEFINRTNQLHSETETKEKIQHKLLFDGKRLIDQQYIDSKLVRSVAYPATSGVVGGADPKQKNRGPIPEGKYYLNTKDISHNPLRVVSNNFLGIGGYTEFPYVLIQKQIL